MLDRDEMERLVDMQHRSYLLLRWTADAVKSGFVSFDAAHTYSTFPEAVEKWILGHYLNIPEAARPDRSDLAEFCEFFTTYLSNSFDFVDQTRMPRNLREARCFCPICSWLVQTPNLKPKKLLSADKRRAMRMRETAMKQIMAEHRLELREDQLEELLKDRSIFEDVSLVAYGHDLLQRVLGVANGPAVLALWRGFAWHESGSPRHGYRLTSDSILEAEDRVLTTLKSAAAG